MTARNLLLVCLATGISAFVGACTEVVPPEPPDDVKGSPCGQNAVVGCYDEFAHEEVSLTCVLPTSRWNKIHLRWRLDGRLNGLDEEGQYQAVKDAIKAWDDATALTFEEVSESQDTDITIRFVDGDHGDPFPFGQEASDDSNVLGHAYFPSFPGFREPQYSANAGDVHISSDERWALEPLDGKIDLFTVVLHELGHALGLPHSGDVNAVMYPEYPPLGFRELPGTDLIAAARLYGSEDGSIPPDPVLGFSDVDCDPANYTDTDVDPDSDRDGLPDSVEVFVTGTNPLGFDTDGDGLSDGVEVLEMRTSALYPNTPDQDDDKLPDDRERELRTGLNNPDSDDDGLEDGEELLFGTNPLDRDSDKDCALDGVDEFPSFPASPLPVDCLTPQPLPCDDGLFCNGIETGTSPECIEGEAPCAADQNCDEQADRCVTPPVPCTPELCDDDGLFCTGPETCMNGVCGSTGNPCVAQDLVCDEDTDRCVQCLTDVQCNDESECTTDVCIDQVCVHTSNMCDDVDACTIDSCVEDQCVHVPGPCGGGSGGNACTGVTCNDGNACTSDTCVNGACISTPVNCPDDGLFCNGIESCNPLTGACQSSGNPCSGIQVCIEKDDVCVPRPCETDSDCDDHLLCNGFEVCDDNSVCVAGGRPCNDAGGEGCQSPDATERCAEGPQGPVCLPCSGCLEFTIGPDVRTGTEGDDCFEALLVGQTATLQTGDMGAGLDGFDVLSAMVNGTPTAPMLSGIESLNFTALVATTVQAEMITGAVQVNTVNSTDTLTIAPLPDLADLGVVDVSNGAAGLAVGFAPAVTMGTSDSIKLTVVGSNAGSVAIETGGTNGFETLNVLSTGAPANRLASIVHNHTNLGTASFSGNQQLIVGTTPNSVRMYNAGGLTANLTLGGGTSVNGPDSYVPFATTDLLALIGGSGDDLVIFGSTLDSGDEMIDLGPGVDVVQASFISMAQGLPTLQNVEEIRLNASDDAFVSFVGVTGLSIVTIEADGTRNRVLLFRPPLNSILHFRGNNLETVQVYDSIAYEVAGGIGQADKLHIGVDNRGTPLNAMGAANVHDIGPLTVSDIETINISVTDGPATFFGLTATTLRALNVSGSSDVTLGTVDATASTVLAVNASNVTGNFSATVNDIATGANIALGGGNDAFTIGAGSTGMSTLNTLGDGNDTFTGDANTASADTISAGDGNDTINGGLGVDTVTTGNGSDIVIYDIVPAAANAKNVTDFTSGAGGDILRFDISALALASNGAVDSGLMGNLSVDDDIFVVTGRGHTTDAAAETAMAADDDAAGSIVYVYFNMTDSSTHILYDPIAETDHPSAVLLGRLTNISTQAAHDALVAANLDAQP